MKNVKKSYRREKSNKILKNWIKQQIPRKLKMRNSLKIAYITVKSWLIQVAYTFASY